MSSSTLTITQEEWLKDLEEAEKQFIQERRVVTKEQLELITLAREKNYSWKAIALVLSHTYNEDFHAEKLRKIWDYWKDRREEW